MQILCIQIHFHLCRCWWRCGGLKNNSAIAGMSGVGIDLMWNEVMYYGDVASVSYVETMYYARYRDTEAVYSIIYDVDHLDEDALL
jgi:hypothetical protein